MDRENGASAFDDSHPRDGLTAPVKVHVAVANREAKAELAAYRARRADVLKAVRVYNAAVVTAGVGVQVAGTKLSAANLATLLGQLAQIAQPLKDALQAFGVTLPGGL